MPARHELLDRLRHAVFTGAGGARYRILDMLGEGGQGWVFKAAQDDAGSPFVVVKVLRPDVATTDVLARFEREAAVLRALSSGPSPHPHIVRFHEHGRAAVRTGGASVDVPYLVLEYVDGPPLSKVLAAHGGFGLPVARVRRILRQVARALMDMHAQGVVHRDLKPSNILLSQSAGTETAKVTDFGLVKKADPAHQTITIAGASAGYAPPEQYEVGNRRVTPRTDVFAFGAILFEALSGCEAFPVAPGDTALRTVARLLGEDRPSLARVSATIPRELREKTELTAALDREIARATDGDPDKRHASIEDLWSAIEPLLRAVTTASASRPPDAPVSAPSSGPTSADPPSKPGHRITGKPMTGERLRGAVFSADASSLVAAGAFGLYRFSNGVWSAMRAPRGLDPRALRAIARAPSGDLLVLDDTHAALLSPSGSTRILDAGGADILWLGALADERGIVLTGERRSRSIGVVALFPPDSVSGAVLDVPSTTRLLAATRLDAGLVLACGTHGALVTIDGAEILDVPWGRTGHLHAAASAPDGGAFVVGSGGHALAIGAPHPSLRGVPPSATLESVQTTRDLHGVVVDPSGTAFAVGAQGRLLVRRAGTWSRVPVDLGAAGLIAVTTRPAERRARDLRQPFPRDVGPSLPRDVGPSLPRDVGPSLPRDAGQSLPRDAGQSLPRELVAVAEDGTVVEIALP